MLKVKATKTDRYAQRDPSKPCVLLIKDGEYELDEQLASRVKELGGCEIIGEVVEKVETPESKSKEVETPENKLEKVENKERQQPVKQRAPGQTKK